MDEFLYDYNENLIADLLTRKFELLFGELNEEATNEPKETEARNFFQEMGF